MKRFLFTTYLLPLLAGSVFAGQPDPATIIQRFAAKESEFQKIWQQYTYNQKVEVQVLGFGDRVTERQTMEIEVYFTTDGKRKTRVLEKNGRLQSVRVTDTDVKDAVALQPFVLTTEEIPDYDIKYVDKKYVDELETYIFDVSPRKIEKHKRYFEGRVWVDTEDLQIVMTRGKAVPEDSYNKFPHFETRREQIDGKYWFPTWTLADDYLNFGQGFETQSVHIRELITYRNFKKFEVGATIKYERTEGDSSKPKEPKK